MSDTTDKIRTKVFAANRESLVALPEGLEILFQETKEEAEHRERVREAYARICLWELSL